jgi:prepilin signal peptidase PulO-like enzyme (type II secretory pathway)
LGGGDVKFMSVAGLYLGFSGTIPVILFGTVIAALTGLVLILLKKINRKDSIPLAPFLFIGIIITVFLSSGG